MASMKRRDFLKRSAAAAAITATAVSGASSSKVLASDVRGRYAMAIDLTKCDGCANQDTPQCVIACREKNRHRYPEPIENIPDYWPQTRHEDWSQKKELTTRLTPYNWIFVQQVEVVKDGKKETISIPRRCMHCDNPPCVKMCPFGVMDKTEEGAVRIDHNYCMGGAKCRDVCPWDIPQRQAGVGVYLKLIPKFAGGGVMYKCDFCQDLISQGKTPVCVDACPNQAMTFGLKDEIQDYAKQRAVEIQGHIYGAAENSGTGTLYISPVSFAEINEEVKKQESPFHMGQANNPLDTVNGIGKVMLLAPVAGIAAAGIASYKAMKGDK